MKLTLTLELRGEVGKFWFNNYNFPVPVGEMSFCVLGWVGPGNDQQSSSFESEKSFVLLAWQD